jgi:hypothetical protein
VGSVATSPILATGGKPSIGVWPCIPVRHRSTCIDPGKPIGMTPQFGDGKLPTTGLSGLPPSGCEWLTGSTPSWHQIIASWFKPSRYLQYLKAAHLCQCFLDHDLAEPRSLVCRARLSSRTHDRWRSLYILRQLRRSLSPVGQVGRVRSVCRPSVDQQPASARASRKVPRDSDACRRKSDPGSHPTGLRNPANS